MRSQGGQAPHLVSSNLGSGQTRFGHTGHTGGTTSDFKMYRSSCPVGICDLGTPGGNELE